MISRQKLIEDMKRKCVGNCLKCEHFTILSSDYHCGVIDDQPPADQWIPCSILPPRGKKVLIHMAEDFYDTAWFDGYNFRTKEFFTTVENVIAWKYIEPYKGGGVGETI